MKPILLVPLVIAACLSACDKPSDSNVSDSAAPARTKAERPTRSPREETPDHQKELREELSKARKIDDAGDREAAITEVVWNALELAPDLATEALAQLTTDSSGKLELIQHLAMTLADEDPEQAIEWAANAGSETEIAAAYGKVALVISDTDPERAAHLLSKSGIAGGEFDRTVVEVLDRWAEENPADATAWVLLFPEGRARDAGIKVTVSQWLDTDAAATFAWTATLQDDAVRKEVSLAMADILADEPEKSREKYLRHADSKTRVALDQELSRILSETDDE